MSFNRASRLAPGSWRTPNPWESWYAWYPVKVKGKWTWLTKVYRKYNWARSTEQPFGAEYDYGDLFDVLAAGTDQSTQPKTQSFKGLQDG